MITSIILFSILAALVILLIKFFTGKSKKQSEKSSLESIASTLTNKWNKGLKQIANGMRDWKTVRDELLEAINKACVDLQTEFKSYLTVLITNEERHKVAINNANKRIPELKSKAKENKEKFLETKDVKYKSYAERYIAQIITFEKIKQTSTEYVSNAKEIIEDAKMNFELMLSELNSKKSEIECMVVTPENTFNLSKISINELTSEFKIKLTEHEVDVKVKGIVNGVDTDNTNFTNATSDEVNNMFNTL